MKRSYNKCVIFLALIFVCECVNAKYIMKRDDGSMLNMIESILGNVPLIGGILKESIQETLNLYEKLEELTNGALGRLLGGAFPCTIDVDTHLVCTGITAQSSLSDITKALLDPVPSLVIPSFVKNIIYMLVDGGLVPLIDVILGGLSTNNR